MMTNDRMYIRNKSVSGEHSQRLAQILAASSGSLDAHTSSLSYQRALFGAGCPPSGVALERAVFVLLP
jgi:hypothetical protein